MKNFKKVLGVILSLLVVLYCVPIVSLAADEKPKAGQYNLIVEEDGRTTHWEDENGNTVELGSASLPKSQRKAKAAVNIPEKYDARESGLVTPAKAQGIYGTCWAFAATSCIESNLIKNGLADSSIDLSEDHLVWFSKNSLVTDESDTTHGDGGTFSDMDSAFKFGGTWMDSISTYARGSGPVYDKDYPYATGNWSESDRYNAEYRVTDCSSIDVTNANMTKIKAAIMQYGSVKTSYYSHTGFYNVTDENGSAYYYPDANGRTNHDVVIVGWDDNYSVKNFNYEYQPSRKGAWLVKNSWGENSNLLVDGYFWMSYDESEVKTVSYYTADVKSIYDNTYQYDGVGSYSALYYMGRSSAYGSNVFTAKNHENLNYVGFYCEAGANYTIYIYKLGKQTDYPTNGTLVSTTYGSQSCYGYHTAKLSTPVEVNAGDVFSVILQINMPNGSDAKIFTEGLTYDTACGDYESYFGTDKQFMDMVSKNQGYFTTAGNVCLKVMSKDISVCNHNYTSSYTAPTCTSRGGTTYNCSICGDSYMTDIVAPTEHTVVIDNAVAPTCTEAGLTEGKHCSVCNLTLVKQKSIPSAGHNWVGTVIKQPTCTEDGISSNVVCSVCNESYGGTITIPATGHTAVYDEATEATCTEPGYSAGTHCSVCNTILSGHYIIWAAGHSEVSVAAVAATCAEPGHTAGTQCSVCGAITSGMETIPATGHSYGDWVPTEGGGQKRVCSVCGDTQTKGAESCKHVVVIDSAVAPTCTETGLTEGSHCSICGAVTKAQEVVGALGHTQQVIPAIEATCTEAGLTEGLRCSACKTVLKEQESVPATGHSYGKWETEREATCTQNGILKKVCSSCGNVFKSMQAKKNHTYVTDKAVAPTCTKTGLTEGMHCSSCKTVVTAQTVIPALGHSYGGWNTVKNASCTAEGEAQRACSLCQDVQTKSLEKTAHTESAWIVDNAANCVNGGSKHTECTFCHSVLNTAEIPATGIHDYTDIVTAPTCTTTGYTTHTCTVCGKSVVDSYTEKLAHAEKIVPAVKATCTKTGLTEGKECSVCGEVILAQTVVPAKGHSYGGWNTVKNASCTAEGEAQRACSNCGNTETLTLEKTAHTYNSVKSAPTCITGGYTTHTCTLCKSSYTDSRTAPLGHSMNAWTQTKAPSCTESGEESRSCSRCDAFETRVLEKTAHSDENNDGLCDSCGQSISKDCTCACHSTSAFSKFLWKIKLFFIKLFKVQRVCSCGAKHY